MCAGSSKEESAHFFFVPRRSLGTLAGISREISGLKIKFVFAREVTVRHHRRR